MPNTIGIEENVSRSAHLPDSLSIDHTSAGILMFLVTKWCRTYMPYAAQEQLKHVWYRIPIHLKLSRIMTTYTVRGLWPFKKPLSHEIYALERKPRANSLKELDKFSEMRGSAWLGLESVAYQIVYSRKPRVIVELGTHMGLSALAMGLALRDLGEGGRIYAVDSWEGDPQAGYYDDAIYNQFCERIRQLGLESIVLPLRMYFEQAKDQVESPIDLLHIDGLHTWEAVNLDFDTFGPMVRPGGLVFFHDIQSRYKDLSRFWAGISKTYDSHTIPYSQGLGLIRIPTV